MTAEDTKETKNDEEQEIDFSKIKSWFKKDRKDREGSEEQAAKKSDADEQSAEGDASDEKAAAKEMDSEDSEELSIDYKSAIKFFKRYSTIFLILIPVLITIYLRLQPMQLPMTDDWAENTVHNYYKNQIASQINQQYPNLPNTNKEALIEAEFEKFMQENRDMLDQQISMTSQGFKDRMMYDSGDSKYVYLGDIDSYFWLREVRKLNNNGTVCDEIDYEKKLCYQDTYTRAPIKYPSELGKEKASPYSWSILYVFKFLKFFNPDMTIMQASFYTPLIYAIISAIFAFLIGKLIAGNIAGLFTSIVISVNPTFLSRTLGSDNDPLTIFFPLLIVLLFISTVQAKNTRRTVIYGLLTASAISAYAYSWQGWWFMFDFIIATLVIYAGFHLVRLMLKGQKLKTIIKSKEIKDSATVFGVVLVASAILITIVSNFQTFLHAFNKPLWFIGSKVAARADYWPNVLVTVAEFNPGTIGSIISQMGGKLMFFLGLMGILFVMTGKDRISREQKYMLGFGALIYIMLVSKYGTGLGPKTYMILTALPVAIGMLLLLKSEEEVDVRMAILLVIWFVATTFAALTGVRFTLLMVSAFGVAFGITIAKLYRLVSKWISTELKISESITKAVVLIVLLLVLVSPVKAGYYAASHFMPSVNDAWYESLTKIRDNSEGDAIINSWWDFGHWFKYIADRRVTLDGSSQGGPPLHWLGKLMVTDDEKHSVGILRMLDCGSNNAFDELNAVLDDTAKSIEVLDKVVRLDKKEAGQKLLEEGLTREEAGKVLKYTHCEPPEDFFITSEDMVGKAGVWSHFGSWDFLRAEMYNRVKGTEQDEGQAILEESRYNLTPEQVDQYYYEIQTEKGDHWITPWPGYLSGVRPCEEPEPDGMMVCNQVLSNGQQIPFIINLTDMDVIIPSAEGHKPESIVYVTENGTEEKFFEGNLLEFSMVLVPSGYGYSSLITHPYLSNSIFTRLFYLEGHGLEHFNKFNDKTGVNGWRIITWKVDWEGEDMNKAFKQVEANATTDQTTGQETETDPDSDAEPEEKDETDETETHVDEEEEDVLSEDDIETDISAEETNEE